MGIDAGLSNVSTGNVLSAVTALGVLGALLVTWLQNRFGHVRPLTAGTACRIVASLLPMFAISRLVVLPAPCPSQQNCE
jgi:cyanate permease